MTTKRKLAAMVTLTLAIIVATIPLWFSADFKHRNARPPLRIAVSPWPGYGYLPLAKHLGYFKGRNVNVEIVHTSSLDESRDLFISGNVDAMASTTVELLQADNLSLRRPKIVTLLNESKGLDVILAKPEIRSVEELRGRTIGVTPKSIGYYVLIRALESVGLKIEDVTTVPLSQEEKAVAIKTGKVDAITSYPPTSIEIANEIDINEIFSSSEIPGEIIDVLVFSGQAVAQRFEDIKSVIDGHQQALSIDIHKNSDARQFLASFSRLTEAQFLGVFDKLGTIRGCQQLDLLANRERLRQLLKAMSQTLQLPTANVVREPVSEAIIQHSFRQYCHE